ncbi:MAG TPA: class I SAM-dependent methyltransferase [Spirochaetota bacterium]|nr:class I SAM-dependent methyltransferase [Spirochaetota bacterium]
MKTLILKIIGKILIILKPFFVFIFELESFLARKWATSAHKRLFWAKNRIPKDPEFFDHHIDLYYLWPKNGTSWWLERGIFSALALRKDGNILELACGDGFNAKHFYSYIAKSVIACDFDKSAIKTAKRKNSAKNITFLLRDIRNEMPEGEFDNIVFDAAIEHFTPDEINLIMKNIKERLSAKKGILSGYTIVKKAEGKSLEQHEYEFEDMSDLKRFLTPYFKNVIVFETIYPERHNLYFWASDGTIPFSKDWDHWLIDTNHSIQQQL